MSERIAVSPHIRFGKPCVAGTRITVQEVLELVLEGLGIEEIHHDHHSMLTADDIRACIQYAIDLIGANQGRMVEMA